LRDYSGFNGGPPFNSGFPYNQTNFVFFGDDTSSSQADVQIGSFQVVPEPASIVLLTVGGAMMLVTLCRKRVRNRPLITDHRSPLHHQPMTMLDSIALRARSKSSPVSCMYNRMA
jgi:hypothetical protein